MDVFLMIRRHKMTIFADAKETTTVQELKKIVEGILKRPPEEQQLYKDDWLLEDVSREPVHNDCSLGSLHLNFCAEVVGCVTVYEANS
uniref:Ubiquitin-like domain-containing protein n=1 Tax=Gopherus evgoodei TaxID=1825980 RepID=A0A8C4W488_9SAUR